MFVFMFIPLQKIFKFYTFSKVISKFRNPLNQQFGQYHFSQIIILEILALHKICENKGFHRLLFSSIRTIYRRIRVSENLYSRIFYAMQKSNKRLFLAKTNICKSQVYITLIRKLICSEKPIPWYKRNVLKFITDFINPYVPDAPFLYLTVF